MTEFDADLLAHLEGDAAIVAAIEDVAENERRIYPVERPQGQKNLRALVYTVIAGVPEQDLEGDATRADLENVRLQIDVWGADHDSARALAKLVRSRMEMPAANQSIRAVLKSRQSDVDPGTREHREILDFSVWHSPQ